MNIPRLATRNRRHWNEGETLMRRIAEDGQIDPPELSAWMEWQQGGVALGSVIDINDARGRATSVPQVQALNAECESWLPLLPELKTEKGGGSNGASGGLVPAFG